jgi:hypothetical protein
LAHCIYDVRFPAAGAARRCCSGSIKCFQAFPRDEEFPDKFSHFRTPSKHARFSLTDERALDGAALGPPPHRERIERFGAPSQTCPPGFKRSSSAPGA